jgi:hypothetical protein
LGRERLTNTGKISKAQGSQVVQNKELTNSGRVPRQPCRPQGARSRRDHKVDWCAAASTEPVEGKAATHANGGTIGFACTNLELAEQQRSSVGGNR